MPEVSLWQLTLEPSGQFLDPGRLATNLFMICIRIFNELTGIEDKEFDPAMLQVLNHQKHRFKLWGANFDAREGGLDEHYEGADHLRETLFRVLRRMAEALVTMAHQTSLAEDLTDVFQQIEELKSQVSQVIDKRAMDEDADERRIFSRSAISFPRISLDDFSSTESEGSSQDEGSQLEEAAKDVEFSNDLLFQLGPALHDNAERAALKREMSGVHDERSQQMLHTGAGPYIASVLESYPSINPELARRLGEAN